MRRIAALAVFLLAACSSNNATSPLLDDGDAGDTGDVAAAPSEPEQAGDDSSTFGYTPCKSYFIPGFTAPLPVQSWGVTHLKGDFSAFGASYGAAYKSVELRTSLSSFAKKCALDGTYGMAAAPAFTNGDFLTKLQLLSQWRADLLKGSDVPAIAANMTSVAASIKQALVATMAGSYQTTRTAYNGLCTELTAVNGQLATNLAFIDAVDSASKQVLFVRDVCAPASQQAIRKLSDDCLKHGSYCKLSKVFNGLQECEDFVNLKPGAPIPGDLSDLVATIRDWAKEVGKKAQECPQYVANLDRAWADANK